MIDEKSIVAKGVFKLMPARRTGADTVTVYDNDPQNGGSPTYQFEHLRQQSDKASGKPNFSLACRLPCRFADVNAQIGRSVYRHQQAHYHRR